VEEKFGRQDEASIEELQTGSDYRGVAESGCYEGPTRETAFGISEGHRGN